MLSETFFKLRSASPVEFGQSLELQKDYEGHFLVQKLKILISAHAWAKNVIKCDV